MRLSGRHRSPIFNLLPKRLIWSKKNFRSLKRQGSLFKKWRGSHDSAIHGRIMAGMDGGWRRGFSTLPLKLIPANCSLQAVHRDKERFLMRTRLPFSCSPHRGYYVPRRWWPYGKDFLLSFSSSSPTPFRVAVFSFFLNPPQFFFPSTAFPSGCRLVFRLN